MYIYYVKTCNSSQNLPKGPIHLDLNVKFGSIFLHRKSIIT